MNSSPKISPQDNVIEKETNSTPVGSWRQAIFNRVVTPGKSEEKGVKKNKKEYRELWKTAINQQILLIRMERENARLKGKWKNSGFQTNSGLNL